MPFEILIRRSYASALIAESIKKSLQPDNIGIPTGMSIELGLDGSSLIIRIVSTGDLPSFLRTVDDLLMCLQAAETTIEGLRLDRLPS